MTAFPTFRSEGGLLPHDLLERIAALDPDVAGLAAADYRLDPGVRHGEAISRSWARLVPAWHAFRAELAKLPSNDPATTVTRERFLQPLLQELGYGRVPTARALTVDGRDYAISHAWGDLPIHLLGARVSLDDRQAGLAGAARSSPHGLVQDLLNRSSTQLWALLSNGLVLRLLRDHHSLTSQAYVEVDLEALFEGERYADFALLWLVFHQSRVEAAKPEECRLEQWFALSRYEGVRALDKLRGGVERAIEHLGAGFLRHPRNAALRQRLADDEHGKHDLYRQLLRLVYRLIFLFSAEDRGMLLDPRASEAARERYRRYYATRRLRDLAGTVRGGPHGDLWQGLRTVMTGLDEGCPPLGLPALGSFLWSSDALPDLQEVELANVDLLAALRELSYLQRDGQRYPIAWRTVAADELGSLYEGLLELHPRVDAGAGAFVLDTAAGHERKKTGSYYTPTSLVDCLLDSALDPVIDAAVAGKPKSDAEKALLALRVVDPACGSGHFLVAAARRLARRLASVRTGDDEPSPRELSHALRDVVGRCIFGVDLNEMAVELCKVALWMEGIEPGRPLSFLDAHIVHGNALLGATPALLDRGVPDEAWDALGDPKAGDSKEVAKALRKRNRDARKQAQATMWDGLAAGGGTGLADAARDALAGGDDELADVKARKRRWEALQSSASFRDQVFVADTWCAAFVWPKPAKPDAAKVAAGESAALAARAKEAELLAAEAPTHEVFTRIARDPSTASKALRREVSKLARQYTFFHWHLAFPEVFTPRQPAASDEASTDDVTGWTGGFDCVLGNPPWERVKLQEKEFFAGRDDSIAGAENASIRKKLIAKLPERDPALWTAWTDALRQAEGESHWLRQSGRYPLCGRGDINTYSIFAELNRSLMGERGRVGCIVPGGIATDDTTKDFFASLVDRDQLAFIYHFDNDSKLFEAVTNRVRYCILGLAGGDHEPADLVFYALTPADLADPARHLTLTPEDFAVLNPNTRTCPTFRWRRDAEINKAIYRRLPVLWREGADDGNPWGLSFLRMLDMATDSGAFKDRAACEAAGFELQGNVFAKGSARRLPLYEAKMVHLFDHRFGTYDGQTQAQANKGFLPQLSDSDHTDPSHVALPYYWVDEQEVESRLDGRWSRSWLLGWRDITRSSDMRTVITAALPRVAVGDKYLLLLPGEAHAALAAALLGNLGSLVFD